MHGVEAMRTWCLLLVATLGVAGCSGPAEAPEPAAVQAPFSQSTLPPPTPPPQVFVGICEVTAGVSYGALGLTYNSMQPGACPFSAAREGDLSDLTAGLIEVVWAPASPTTTGAGLLVESDDCRSRFSIDASGPHQESCSWGTARAEQSPLSFLVEQPAFGAAGDQNLTVLVLPEGLTLSQPMTIYVSLFEAAPADGYTAIPA